MGEEIIMSTRLWTSGYDIFSPSQSVVGHMYVRRHQPKFWETVSSSCMITKSFATFFYKFVLRLFGINPYPFYFLNYSFVVAGWA
jgi:hypothetical protein